jgi:hypothetical protein
MIGAMIKQVKEHLVNGLFKLLSFEILVLKNMLQMMFLCFIDPFIPLFVL